VQLPQRMPYSGAPLVRVLARMTRTGVPASDVALLDRLSQWLGWTDAIALSSALDAAGPAPAGANAGASAGETPRGDATIATLEAAVCARTRATLTEAIRSIDSGDGAGDGGRRGMQARRGDTTHLRTHLRTHLQTHLRTHPHAQSQAHPPTQLPRQANVAARGKSSAESVDFALFRQVYQTQQQSMESAIGELRVRLRATLATRSERHARLALVDATMERALDAREHSVLAALPALLEAYFRRLRDAARVEAEAKEDGDGDGDGDGAAAEAAEAAEATAPTAAAPRANAWLDTFRDDMRAVLLAELDVRFQPVEGLLAALRAS
jgi:hypothetical protein